MADEPADHEVVRNQQFVPVLLPGDAEVFDSRPQSYRVLVALVVGHAVEPGKPAVIHGVGPVLAGKILGHIGDITRFPTSDHFASYTGTAPIEASSG